VSRETDSAYIAGFFDGEGCVGVHTDSRNMKPYLMIRANNTDRVNLQFLADKIGGHVQKNPRSARRKPIYLWLACGVEAAMILSRLLPYLIDKKERAELGIECMTTPYMARKLEIVDKMRELNKKGVDVKSDS